ncbi:MAG: hypothetical protein HY962_00215 [Ignavibacteriae bacterium]|nr:hypothetical protein [Ignavibacteriota bacterium]
MQEIESYFDIVRIIHSLGLSYMITGSVGAMMYGEPRVTNDIDVVMELSVNDIPRLVDAFPASRYYCPPGEIVEVEVRRAIRGHFNIIDQSSGFKADIYPVGTDSLRLWAFAHTRTILYDDMPLVFAPPEYIIIRKLEYYREGGSDKHLRDIRAMRSVSEAELDFNVLQREIAVRQLDDLWALVSHTN